MTPKITLLSLILAPFCTGLAADLRLPSVFADHMVLQRGQPVPVWGWTDGGNEVTVRFGAQVKKAVADAEGRWMLRLDPMPESMTPQSFHVESSAGRLVFEDVLVGEVWLCSGQSNMAMTVDGETKWLYVGGIADAKEVVRQSANPLIRQFRVEWKTATQPQQNADGKWMLAGPDATAQFSATGYFFAKELYDHLKVPVAIVSASFGGSAVESWISKEGMTLEGDPESVAQMNQKLHDFENHDARIARYAGELADWEKATHRQDPRGSEDDAEWAAPTTQEGRWTRAQLPSPLSKLGCPHGGVIWLRKEIEIPETLGERWRLDFPACRAFAAIYLNGSKVFETTPEMGSAMMRPSRPGVGKGIARAGKNILTIKLHGYTGDSGIRAGAFAVVPFDGKQQPFSLHGDWMVGVEKAFEALPPKAPVAPVAPEKGALHFMPVPSLFNAMVHPLIPYAIRGVAWYQGESNVGNALYGKHLQILVRDWRRWWKQGDFPFYVNQLAGFGARKLEPTESPWAECREMQMAVLKLPNTGIANLIDTCEDGDLHPLNKQDAGRRLAWVALAKTYEKRDLPSSGPLFESARRVGSKVSVQFQKNGSGLATKSLPQNFRPNLRKPEIPPVPLELPSPGSPLQGFALCEEVRQADGTTQLVWRNALARIEGESVLVWSDLIKEPVGVRYAWADHPVCNLTSAAGLPAFPFRFQWKASPAPK